MIVATGDDGAAVRAEGRRPDTRMVQEWGASGLVAGYTPDLRRSIGAGRQERVSRGAKGDRADARLMNQRITGSPS